MGRRIRQVPGALAALVIALTLAGTAQAGTGADAVGRRVVLDGFAIDATEVTIGQLRRFRRASGRATRAEREGGGFEYVAGWQRRRGWNWASPYGEPGTDREPATHVTWHEARAYCESVGGRLPGIEEWRRAAYLEMRTEATDGFERSRRYTYPVGDQPVGMNTSDADRWPRHAPVAETRRGVNGLYDMGANVWEWLADRRGDEVFTAGGSWWYGPSRTRAEGAQYKPAGFAAVYIGFRCAYDVPA